MDHGIDRPQPTRAGRARRAVVATLVASVALVTGVSAAPAAASTVALVDSGPSQNQLDLVFRAARRETNRVTITMGESSVTVTDRARVHTGDPNCTEQSSITVVCQTPIGAVPSNIDRADISLGDRSDTLTVRSTLPGTCRPHLTPSPVVFVSGGPRDHRGRGSARAAKLMGGTGNDTISAGPCDSDILVGGPGNDKLTGGPNDDNLLGGPRHH